MIKMKNKAVSFNEKSFEKVLSTACYISLPLIFLFALTIGLSMITTGGINTNVNEMGDFRSVFFSFSLPMLLALAAAPLFFKMCIQKRSAAELGLAIPKSPLNLVACGLMSAGTAGLAFILSVTKEPELSPWTIWAHFFFVAVSEEIMLRSIIMDELRFFTAKRWILCLLNGVIFAFVYHSNDGFLPNLLIRVPLGFALGMVREKSDSVYPAIALHWLYNMFVTTM